MSQHPSLPRPVTAAVTDDDFARHLQRGAALLAEGRRDEARSELDRAYETRAVSETEGDLLARLYYKLGARERAQEIYTRLVEKRPERIPPRFNLALLHLRADQMLEVIDQLGPVVRRRPGHAAAWGYLGVAWARIGETDKAHEAFLRGGHEALARRMEEVQARPGRRVVALRMRADGVGGEPPGDLGALREPEASFESRIEAIRRLADTAFEELDLERLDFEIDEAPPPARVSSVPPPAAPEPAVGADTAAAAPAGPAPSAVTTVAGLYGAALTPEEFARHLALGPGAAALELEGGALLARAGCAVRLAPTAVTSGFESGEVVWRTGTTNVPFAGQPRLVWVRAGWALVPVRPGVQRVLLTVREPTTLIVREDVLAAFEPTVHFDNAMIDFGDGLLRVVALRGHGRIALEVAGALRAIAATARTPVALPVEVLVAWTDGLTLEQAARSEPAVPCVELEGEGTVFAVLAAPAADGPRGGE